MTMQDRTTTPWTEDEEQAFTEAIGRWVRAWFRECARTGENVLIGPMSEVQLALIWRAGREYEKGLEGRGANDTS